MIFPNDILLIIREFSKPLTRPDWKTAKRFTNSKLKYHLININPSYNFNINKILNPRFYTINDLPFKIKIGMIFYYEQNILEIINRYTFTDNNKHDMDRITCKNQYNIIFDAIIIIRKIILSNGNEDIHENIYIRNYIINRYDFI